uniref:Uncharacterized protein n=1 Tax=Arundo donax TaxID=35708 RepID=A0A0A9C3Y1_ARUDO
MASMITLVIPFGQRIGIIWFLL